MEKQNKSGMKMGETEHKQPGVSTGCLSTVCVRLSISPQSLSCLLSPPGLLTVLAAFSPISSCQGCIPDPSAPAVESYMLNLHSAFFFMHLKKGSPGQAINTIAHPQGVGGRLLQAPLPATIVRELRTGSRTHLQVFLQPANKTCRALISYQLLQHNLAIIQ